jgi:signal transduction histidine kinase
LTGLVTRVFDRQREAAATRQVTLEHQIEPNLPLIEVHEGYLENAVMRLVDNGIKFSKHAGGHVWVKVAADGGRVCCTVKDDGMGIPADEVEKIFDRFHQINRQRIEQQGAGIGLAIVKNITDLHQGEMTCTSTEGVGTEFTIRLPLL